MRYGASPAYAGFKRDVGDAVVDLLAQVRERYGQLRNDERALEEILVEGADKARAFAADTVGETRTKMGLGRLR